MVTNEIQFFDPKDFSKGIIYKLRLPGVAAIGISKAPGSYLSAFVPEAKVDPFIILTLLIIKNMVFYANKMNLKQLWLLCYMQYILILFHIFCKSKGNSGFIFSILIFDFICKFQDNNL